MMTTNNINNIRKDIFTNKRFPKEELIRLSKHKDNSLELDVEQNKLGRGIYIHRDSLAKIWNTDKITVFFKKRKYIVTNDLITELNRIGEQHGKK